MSYEFDHESLHAYTHALAVARAVRAAKFARGDSALADQGRRAANSMVLNIAEGRGRIGNARRNHYSIALGSAAELCAVLDLAELPGGDRLQNQLRRVGLLLSRLR